MTASCTSGRLEGDMSRNTLRVNCADPVWLLILLYLISHHF